MKFIRIKPTEQAIAIIEADDAFAAAPDLHRKGVDFGVYNGKLPGGDGISYYVFEYGLYADDLPYFVLDRRLYAGDALFFRYDQTGETVDIGDWMPPPPLWLRDKAAVERAIAHGRVERPVSAINGVVIWSWPNPQ
jgi:hypothetical protein